MSQDQSAEKAESEELSNRREEDKARDMEGAGFDLRLMHSESDAITIPRSEANLIVVANVRNVLYFRIFDADGTVVVDTDETCMTAQAETIADLKKQIDRVRPPHELTRSEKDRIVTAVTSIFGHTEGKTKKELKRKRLFSGSREDQVKGYAVEAGPYCSDVC